ncbi:MAG: serine O-acetyltransferase [Candidatus Baltobacteraceae bacterium]|jgi:serine O-acetyltransferase
MRAYAARPTSLELWDVVRRSAAHEAAGEPLLRKFLGEAILQYACLDEALAALLGSKLADANLSSATLEALAREATVADPAIVEAASRDLVAICERDPACSSELTAFLYFKGFVSLEAYRVNHWLWQTGRHALAEYLQNRLAESLAVDIHPAAQLGSGIFIDHATGVVIGETSVVSDNVSMLQNVTLGGTGKEHGDRHPKIGPGVLIGAGASILGNIRVGEDARIGANSVVLRDVPAFTTVAGVPARVVSRRIDASTETFVAPAMSMDQHFPDYQI